MDYHGVENLHPSFSRAQASVSPPAVGPQTQFPLRDLRDLRAMLSPVRLVLARRPQCPRQQFGPQTQFPLRDLRAMLSPVRLVLARRPWCLR
jgi:hypothetical protein